MFRVYIFWDEQGAGLGWRESRRPVVKGVFGRAKLDKGTLTLIDFDFEGEPWAFAGRSPYGLEYDQKFIIGHISVSGSELLTVCSEVTLKRRDKVRLWVLDKTSQSLAEIGGGDVPRYSKDCRAWVLASGTSAAGNVFRIARPSLREGLKCLLFPGVPYGFTNSESIFSDRALIAAVLIFEKFVQPMADRSGDMS